MKDPRAHQQDPQDASTRSRPPRLLLVDDDATHLQALERIFAREPFEVHTASSGEQALALLRREPVDVVLTDLMMPRMSGLDLLRTLRDMGGDVQVVLVTAYGTIEKAVEAMRHGAYDFLEKPLKRVRLVKAVRRAAEHRRLLVENRSLRAELHALRERPLVGTSPALRHVLEIARQAAPSTATVLLLGESGTGKELLARYLHEQSGRKGPFVAVNLAALPETLVEAELFGHERGAFTGADRRREGRVAQAEGGTLFLDEIGELAPSIQIKLLRLLQEGEYEPLGGRPRRADFRLVAATHRDLKELVREGRFREDLFYRLNVIALHLPTLAERREDVPLLAEHFVHRHCLRNARPPMRISAEAMERLRAYDWPGNVRELENVMERAVVLARGEAIGPGDLPPAIAQAEEPTDRLVFPIGTPLAEMERQAIRAAMRHTGGDKQRAARLLGISTRTIYRKLEAERQQLGEGES